MSKIKKKFGGWEKWTGDCREEKQASYPLDQVDLLNNLWKFEKYEYLKKGLRKFQVTHFKFIFKNIIHTINKYVFYM